MLIYETQPRPQDAFNAAMTWRCHSDAAVWSRPGYVPVKVDGAWILHAEDSDAYVVAIRNDNGGI
jgi:hypothetical protein